MCGTLRFLQVEVSARGKIQGLAVLSTQQLPRSLLWSVILISHPCVHSGWLSVPAGGTAPIAQRGGSMGKPPPGTAAAATGPRSVTKTGDAADALVLEQLIVGVLLFTPLLLLLPTTLVFFAFATLLHWSFVCVRTALAASAAVLRANPAYCIVHHLLCPAAYPAGISLEVEAPPALYHESGSRSAAAAKPDAVYLRLKSVPCSMTLLLTPCWDEVRLALGVSTMFQRMTILLQNWSTSVI